MKKIVAYKVELVYACESHLSTADGPWGKIGLQGWVPFGNPTATSVPGKEGGLGQAMVFQAFVQYEE